MESSRFSFCAVRYSSVFLCSHFSKLYLTLLIAMSLLRAVNSQILNDKESIIRDDIKMLSAFIPGCYSNLQQYHKHAQRGLPSNKRSILIRSELFLLTSPMFNDLLTVYFQDFTKYGPYPFRSGFYSFVFDYKMNVFRMRTFKVKPNVIYANSKSSDYFLDVDLVHRALSKHNLSTAGLVTYKPCDMFWKRIAPDTFVGITGPQCLGSLGRDQVRIGVSMTLSTNKLLLTEGWYNVKDGSNISDVKVPYILHKIKSADDHQSDTAWNDDTADKTKSRRTVQTKSLERRRESQVELDDGAHMRMLRTFHQVAAALNAGYDVTYRVELLGCSAPNQMSLDRTSFGGRVKNFLFVRQDGDTNDRTDYVYFVTKKSVQDSAGSHLLTREITLLRGGRMNVKVTKSYHDPNKIKTEYLLDCRLYDENKGFGAVKMFINDKVKPQKLPSYRLMSRSLDSGHQLRIVTDLSRCQGLKKKPAVILGTTVSDFDTVNAGKTLELYLPLLNEEFLKEKSRGSEGFVAQFLKNGDVELTKVSRTLPLTSDDQWRVGLAYHCKMSAHHHLQGNDENLVSVRVYQAR